MMVRNLVAAVGALLVLGGCATREPVPFATAKDCFYPACSLNVEVVDDGKGGKTLRVENDGNLRMGTRHRLVAIVWNLKTPGYEFRSDSITPHTSRNTSGGTFTSAGAWQQQIYPHAYWYDTYSVTNHNNQPAMLYYDITVYPSLNTPGGPITYAAGIANDAFQGRETGWVSMN